MLAERENVSRQKLGNSWQAERKEFRVSSFGLQVELSLNRDSKPETSYSLGDLRLSIFILTRFSDSRKF